MTEWDARRAIDAVWRIESAPLTAALARMTGDVGVAEAAADEIDDDLLSLIFTACHPVLATEARVPIEVPGPAERVQRLASVLEVIYAIFNEGYAASAGEEWIRADLCEEAMRLGRVLVGLMPREPETLGLTALMELTAARFPARTGPAGEAIPLPEQDRYRRLPLPRPHPRADRLGADRRPLRDRRLPRDPTSSPPPAASCSSGSGATKRRRWSSHAPPS